MYGFLIGDFNLFIHRADQYKSDLLRYRLMLKELIALYTWELEIYTLYSATWKRAQRQLKNKLGLKGFCSLCKHERLGLHCTAIVDASNIYIILSHSFTVLSISDVLLDWKQLRTAHTNPHYTSGQRGSPPNQWQKGTEEMGECMKNSNDSCAR